MKKSGMLFLSLFILFYSASAYGQKSFIGGGAGIGTNLLVGETPLTNSSILPNFGIYGIYKYSDRLNFKLQFGFGKIGIETQTSSISTSFIPVQLIGMYHFLHGSTVQPFLQFGLGGISFTQQKARYYDGLFIAGGGLSAPINDKLMFLISADLCYTTSDQFNGIQGGLNDGYFNFQLGITYNLQQKTNKFQKKYLTPGENIIVDNSGKKADTDQVLQYVKMKSRLNQLKKQLSLREEQIRQIKAQLMSRSEKIKKIEAEVAFFMQKKQTAPNLATNNKQFNIKVVDSKTAEKSLLSNRQIRNRYRLTIKKIQNRDFQSAIRELRTLSENYPNHPLSSNFIYWLGECYYGLKHYKKAVAYFNRVAKYKKSYKLDDALIMAGLSYQKLGDVTKADQKYKELLQKYPGSEYVDKANRLSQAISKKIIS